MVIYCVSHQKMIQQLVRHTGYYFVWSWFSSWSDIQAIILFDQYSETQCGWDSAYMCMCVCMCVCVCACVCVCVCVCVLDRKESKVVTNRALVVAQTAAYLTTYIDCLTSFCEPKESKVVTSRALVVAQTAAYLTTYSGCLTSFCEPLSPHYRCHTGLKNV